MSVKVTESRLKGKWSRDSVSYVSKHDRNEFNNIPQLFVLLYSLNMDFD